MSAHGQSSIPMVGREGSAYVGCLLPVVVPGIWHAAATAHGACSVRQSACGASVPRRRCCVPPVSQSASPRVAVALTFEESAGTDHSTSDASCRAIDHSAKTHMSVPSAAAAGLFVTHPAKINTPTPASHFCDLSSLRCHDVAGTVMDANTAHAALDPICHQRCATKPSSLHQEEKPLCPGQRRLS